MKTKDNIHKVVNLNNFICELSKDYEVLTYAESYMFYSFVQYNKIHTLLYHDYDIRMFVQGDKYCFITAKGNRYEYTDFNTFKKRIDIYLDRLYYISYVIKDILDMIKNKRLCYAFSGTLPIWIEKGGVL